MAILVVAIYAGMLTPQGTARAKANPSATVRGRAPVRELYRRAKIFILLPGQRQLDLQNVFISSASDSVFLDGRPLQREVDYRINYLNGTLLLVEPGEGGEKLSVSWISYPFSFTPVFAARFPGGQPFPAPAPAAARDSRAGEGKISPYRLRFSGSKTVGFSVGSDRGLGIDQSLKVTMVGKLAEDLEVRAFLTDDDLPVQPEGNTEELKHLDKVSIQIKSRHTETQLGDFQTGLEWSRFSAFQRELRGATSKVALGNQSIFAGGGIAKGRFETVNFRGRIGVQGPYELLDITRFNGIVVLPGTETVFLDGRRLKRGSENDYIIDYNRGTVTFTERTAITEDSEIVIDFQMGEDNYQRTTTVAGITSSLAGEKVLLRTFLFQESDNPDDPVRGSLSGEEEELLREAGDDSRKALAPGIEEVEVANDAYLLVAADSITPEHYEFVESGGRYILSFYRAAGGEGNYRTDGFTRLGRVKYAYAGEGRGDYAIGRPLPLPQRKRVMSLGLDAGRGIFFLQTEGNISQYDKNTLSSRNDEDNTGGALKLSGGIRDLELSSTRLSLSGQYSSLEERFVSPDKTRESYFYRNWNLENSPLTGRERITGLNLNWRGESAWDVETEYSRLSRGDISARKGEIRARAGDENFRGLRLHAFDSKSTGNRDRRYALAKGSLAFWHLLPTLQFDSERYRAFSSSAADTGRYYYRNIIALSGHRIGKFKSGLSYSRRRTDALEPRGGLWRRDRENDEVRFEGGYTGGSMLVDLFLTHQETRYLASRAESSHDLARIRYRHNWERAGITSDIGYRISSGEDRKLERAVIFVGENEGDYDKEGREVGQKRGDYMVLYLPGIQAEAVRSVELTWRTSVGSGLRGLGEGSSGGGWIGKIRRNLSLDHFFSVLERSTTDRLWRLYSLDPSLLQSDGVTLYGKNSLRQEWSFFNNVKKFNLRFTFSREDEEDNRSEGISTAVYNRELRLRAEAITGKSLSLSWELGTNLRDRNSQRRGEQQYRVESRSASQVLAYKARPSIRLSFELGLEDRRDEVSRTEQISFLGVPSLNSSVGKKIHLTAYLKFTYTDVKAGEGKPLFFLEEGLRQDWSLIGQYRFTRNISFGVNYTGRREKDYVGEVKTVHALKMESRAYF
ncbi:MAG: hypothetical protein JXB45_03005 [Candidatus Krumholzibacteriota bacterium]|nr:hypothetical protein [Candidatus Krumholzibacteriota bacterium]